MDKRDISKRALIFTGGCQPDFSLVRPLINGWSYVVAADSGLDFAVAAGINPDLVVGDMDSLEDQTLLDEIPTERIRRYPLDKDWSDTELALQACKEAGYTDVVLIGGGGGRLDHLIALQSLFCRPDCPSLWITDVSIAVYIRDKTVVVSGLETTDAVSIFPLGKGNHCAKGEGFFWSIEDLAWDEGDYSLSNRAIADTVQFHSLIGQFLLVLPLRTGISLF